MDNDALISIIIPVYNVKEYLKQCVNSVLSQTYNKLEVLLINDGSTDESGEMCEQLSKQDERIVVIHQENGGLSDARNTGTEVAKGDYVFYLDSDDYIIPHCIERLYSAIKKHNAEAAQVNFYYDYSDFLVYDKYVTKDLVLSRNEAMKALLGQQKIKNFAWGKLIRADIAKKHRFPKGKYFEDTYWMHLILHDCKKYVAIVDQMVYYLQRSMSISGAFSLRNLDQLEGEDIRISFVEKHYPNLFGMAKREFKYKLNMSRRNLQHLDANQRKEYLSDIENYENKYGWNANSLVNKLGFKFRYFITAFTERFMIKRVDK